MTCIDVDADFAKGKEAPGPNHTMQQAQSLKPAGPAAPISPGITMHITLHITIHIIVHITIHISIHTTIHISIHITWYAFSAVLGTSGQSDWLLEACYTFFHPRYAHTQPMMDLLLAPESFLLSERYASAVKTLGLAIFFMPVLPLSCVIALAGQHPVLPPH